MPHQKPAIPDRRDAGPRFVLTHEFEDVDELSEVAKAWDVDFRQLSRGGCRGGVSQAGSERLHLGRARLSAVIHQQGSAPRGLVTFAIPRRRNINLLWRGHTVGCDEVLVYGPGGEIECTSRRDFDMLLVSVSEDEIDSACRRLGVAVSARTLVDLEIVRGDPGILRELRRWMTRTLRVLEREPASMRDLGFVTAARNRAAELIVEGLAPQVASRSHRLTARPRRLAEGAVHLARHYANEVHSVRDLCRESGASERTLRRAFNERFGVSPKTYLQAQRLIGVRRGLRFSGRDVTVSDIANRWGFWHMGQFAADYRRQFGELPSETLRRTRPGGSKRFNV